MDKYRIYVDETGNADLESSRNPVHRFLGLTGAILRLEDVRTSLIPQLEQLKQTYFPHDPDEPPILHRKDLLNHRNPFHTLADPKREVLFNHDLLKMLRQLEYTVVTVVIDKLEHRQKYTVWRHDPYHYCLEVMLERFVMFLEGCNAVGDCMAESRGGKDDLRLKASYARLWREGSSFIDATRFHQRLTSRELKVKPKWKNVAGLQLADMLAHPSRQQVLVQTEKIPKPLKKTFGDEIVEILNQSKYYRGTMGQIWGFGKKMLP